MDILVPILAALVGAVVGGIATACLAALFSQRQAKHRRRLDTASHLTRLLAEILNPYAVAMPAWMADSLEVSWGAQVKIADFTGLDEDRFWSLSEAIVKYLSALKKLRDGRVTPNEAEEARRLAVEEARKFCRRMDLVLDV